MNQSIKLNNKLAKLALIGILTVQFTGWSFLFPKELHSANLSSVSDTLSNSRLSFRGQLSGAHVINTGFITLKTSGLGTAFTSSGTGALVPNDTVKIGTNVPYAIRTIESSSRFSITNSTGIAVAASDGDPVISTSSAIHTVVFTPASAVANGAFRVMIPATSTYDANDGLPDKDGFDFGGSAPTVACTGGTGYTFETGTATASAKTYSTVTYHSFECRYRGNGGTASAITMTIGTAAGNKVINPAPANTTRNPGAADAYTFRVINTTGPNTAGSLYSDIDASLGQIGVIESVRVSATVAPTIIFSITGVAAGVSACGVAQDATTTVNSVPLGTVSTTGFTEAAQLLSVSTNAVSGYSVTASESGLLTARDISGTPTIPNTTCAAGACTVTTTADWTSATFKGFGYALANVTGTPVAAGLRYNTGGTFKARPFGLTGEQIMSGSAPVDTDQAYVCYRITVSGVQQAGDYENQVIYIATATF